MSSSSYEDISTDSTHNAERVLDALRRHRSCIITTHINPDGDAIGSALGMLHLVEALGINARVILPSPAPENLTWFDGAERLEVFSADLLADVQGAECIIVLDLNARSRLRDLGEAISRSVATVINIDHHTHPEDFAHVAWIDTDACSTCSMVANLARHAGVRHASMAMCLYTGIMTDTGSFRFPRTTAEVHRTVADLLDQGADPVLAFERVMNQGSVLRARLLGEALRSMELHADGRLCMMILRRQTLQEYNCTSDDTEGFVHHTLSLAGVDMGVLIIELEHEIKCSFRSKGSVYVRDLAARYGGGGHVYAAGARIAARPLDDVISDVRAAAQEQLSSQSH